MRWAEVNWDVCRGCRKCLARPVCTTRALTRIESDDVMYIEPRRCVACGKCTKACAFHAIVLHDPGNGLKQEFNND